ncbi:MAG TPA: hypothetical protein VIS07_08745 [Candidatus Binatia bacterium]
MYEAEDQAAAHAALAPAAKRGAHAVIELQRPQPGASTKARLAPVGVFLATLGFLLLTHGGHFYAADSLIVHLTATKLVEEQTLELGDVWGTVQGADGKRYGRYGLGLSLLQAPLAWLGKQIDLRTPDAFRELAGANVSIYYPESFAVFFATLLGPLCGALAAAMLWLIARRLGYAPRVAGALVLLLVVATQTWPASRDGFPHVVVLACLLVAIHEVLAWRSLRSPALVGVVLGLLLLVRPFDAVLTSPAVLLYAALRHARDDARAGVLGRKVIALAVPLALAAVVVALHNHLRFGHVLRFDEPGTQAFNTILPVGLYGLLLSSGRGFLLYSPPLLGGLCGLPALARRRPAEAALLLGTTLPLLLGYAFYAHWDGGICWGPRYLAPLVPLLLLPAGELVGAGAAATAFLWVLGLTGAFVQLVGTAVDFHRAAHEVGMTRDVLFDPTKMPILSHWRFLRAGKHLDWLVLRILEARGASVALAWLAVPLALLVAGLALLRRAWRAAAFTTSTSDCTTSRKGRSSPEPSETEAPWRRSSAT